MAVASAPLLPKRTALSAQPCTGGRVISAADKIRREGSGPWRREGGRELWSPRLVSLSLLFPPSRRPLVRPLQGPGPRVCQSGRQAEGRGLRDPAGQGGRHGGVGPGPAVRRPRLPHHQVLQERRHGGAPRVHRWAGRAALAREIDGWGGRGAPRSGSWREPGLAPRRRSGSSSGTRVLEGPPEWQGRPPGRVAGEGEPERPACAVPASPVPVPSAGGLRREAESPLPGQNWN